MHPQIRQVGPGSCPICGMALEPASATAEAGPNQELDRHDAPLLDRRGLAVPVVVLEMGAHLPASTSIDCISPQISAWVQFVLATPVVLWAGWPFFVRGGRSRPQSLTQHVHA